MVYLKSRAVVLDFVVLGGNVEEDTRSIILITSNVCEKTKKSQILRQRSLCHGRDSDRAVQEHNLETSRTVSCHLAHYLYTLYAAGYIVIICLHDINRFVVVMEKGCVYCAVRTKSLTCGTAHVVGLSQQKTVCESCWKKVALGQVFVRALLFLLSITFHECSIRFFINTCLTRRINGGSLKIFSQKSILFRKSGKLLIVEGLNFARFEVLKKNTSRIFHITLQAGLLYFIS